MKKGGSSALAALLKQQKSTGSPVGGGLSPKNSSSNITLGSQSSDGGFGQGIPLSPTARPVTPPRPPPPQPALETVDATLTEAPKAPAAPAPPVTVAAKPPPPQVPTVPAPPAPKPSPPVAAPAAPPAPKPAPPAPVAAPVPAVSTPAPVAPAGPTAAYTPTNNTTTFNTAVTCTACLKAVYKMEEVIAVGRVWHTFCFVCGGTNPRLGCKQTLKRDKYVDHQNQPFCTTCHAKLSAPSSGSDSVGKVAANLAQLSTTSSNGGNSGSSGIHSNQLPEPHPNAPIPTTAPQLAVGATNRGKAAALYQEAAYAGDNDEVDEAEWD